MHCSWQKPLGCADSIGFCSFNQSPGPCATLWDRGCQRFDLSICTEPVSHLIQGGAVWVASNFKETWHPLHGHFIVGKWWQTQIVRMSQVGFQTLVTCHRSKVIGETLASVVDILWRSQCHTSSKVWWLVVFCSQRREWVANQIFYIIPGSTCLFLESGGSLWHITIPQTSLHGQNYVPRRQTKSLKRYGMIRVK